MNEYLRAIMGVSLKYHTTLFEAEALLSDAVLSCPSWLAWEFRSHHRDAAVLDTCRVCPAFLWFLETWKSGCQNPVVSAFSCRAVFFGPLLNA